MNPVALTRLLAGAAVGAGMMYLLDPDGGRRRRAVVRDQIVSAAHKTTDAVEATSRDVTNRARGVVAELRGRFSREEVGDDVLRERVRARIGSVVGRAGGVEAHVDDGQVRLRGPVLTEEVDRLLRRVSSVRGVREVVNELEVHEAPGTIPALQGRPRPAPAGEVFDLLPTRWPPTAGVLGMVGALVVVAGLAAGRRQLGW